MKSDLFSLEGAKVISLHYLKKICNCKFSAGNSAFEKEEKLITGDNCVPKGDSKGWQEEGEMAHQEECPGAY